MVVNVHQKPQEVISNQDIVFTYDVNFQVNFLNHLLSRLNAFHHSVIYASAKLDVASIVFMFVSYERMLRWFSFTIHVF